MVIYIDMFKSILEKSLQEKLTPVPSLILTEYFRILPEDGKAFREETTKFLTTIANKKSIVDRACCHFYVGESNFKKGVIECGRIPKK